MIMLLTGKNLFNEFKGTYSSESCCGVPCDNKKSIINTWNKGYMANNSTPLEQLKSFLNQLFQFDSQDLDFGVYKILHYKRKRLPTSLTNY